MTFVLRLTWKVNFMSMHWMACTRMCISMLSPHCQSLTPRRGWLTDCLQMSPGILQRVLSSLRDICNKRVETTKNHTIPPTVCCCTAPLAARTQRQPNVTVDVHAERMTDSRATLEFSVLTVCA